MKLWKEALWANKESPICAKMPYLAISDTFVCVDFFRQKMFFLHRPQLSATWRKRSDVRLCVLHPAAATISYKLAPICRGNPQSQASKFRLLNIPYAYTPWPPPPPPPSQRLASRGRTASPRACLRRWRKADTRWRNALAGKYVIMLNFGVWPVRKSTI